METKKKLPKKEIGVIAGSTSYLFFAIVSIKICAVDDVECRHSITNKVEVLPGLHKVAVEYIIINHSLTISANAELLFNVKAGCEYQIKEKRSCLVVIDTTSGVVVTSHPINQYTTFYFYSI